MAASAWPSPTSRHRIAALVCLVALINAANRLAVIVHQQGGSYRPGTFVTASH